MNLPLGVAMVAVAAGLPAWVMWKFPEGDDTAVRVAALQSSERVAPAGRNVYQQAAESYASSAA